MNAGSLTLRHYYSFENDTHFKLIFTQNIMPNLNHTGPESKGPKTGRKLGICHKTDSELEETGKLGNGQAKRRNADGGTGKGKRLQYNKSKPSKI